ncbi:MAG: hypothetical protein DDT25_00077 [Chloroflexi bacterium]|nr:hypothetical protein [Chloroflexota bacterium]
MRGMEKYASLYEEPRAHARRQNAIITVLAISVAALAIALVMVFPLQERVPYFVKVEQLTGRVELSNQVALRYEPDERAVRYFLSRWVQYSFTIDEATRPRLLEAYSYMRGAAVGQFERVILETEDPLGRLEKNPAFRRSVEIVSPPQIVAEGSVVMRIALVEGRNVVGRRQINLRYALIPPKDDRDLMRNPIGLWITNLNVVNESI